VRVLRLPVVSVVLALVVELLAFAPAAHALYGPAAGGFGAELVSVDNASDEQGNGPTTDAAISANGRYVVFQTRSTNFFEDDGGVAGPHGSEADVEQPGACREGGIFRYDRLTGQIQLVADGTEVKVNEHGECDPSQVIFTGAQDPSVSENGRYIAFSSAQQLVPQANGENVQVYVRDMEVPLTAERKNSGAYTLVSAENGSEQPAVYDNSLIPTPVPGGDPGAEIWPNTSISASGRYVVFRTAELSSNLPDGGTAATPPDQLFVRDLQEKTTTLLTRDIEGEAPAGGADGPATISADGSTVAWLGSHAPSQTVFLPGEDLDESLPYYMWRRWSATGAATRRITGISDPEDPECKPGEGVTQNPTAEGPCYGPLTYPEASLTGLSGVTPSLSADGDMVAFLAGSSLRPNILKADALDLFLTDMAPGVTRKAGTRELTLAVNGAQGDGNASISSMEMSEDGAHIAFVTQRNAFVLPEPAPLGSFSQNAQQSELYVIDLSTDTLERAVTGLEGAELNGSVLANPSISADGSTVAFASSASNLIFGDANGISDAFVAELQKSAGTASPPPGVNSLQSGFSLSTNASPELGLQVKHGKGGSLILLVETPGAGAVTAQAHGTISTRLGRKTKKTKVVLAHASGAARSEGTTTLVLALSAKYAKNLKQAGKLKASITVDFDPPAPNEALTAEASSIYTSTAVKKAAAKKAAKGATKK
jgi:Tol biopolymer transport system component